MQKYNATVISTTGAPGSGKTYSRCARFLWDWWLPEEKGTHWSNFPVNFEAFKSRYPDVEDRVRIFSPEVLEQWAECDGVSGPWDFFKDIDIQDAHICFDECHNFVPKKGKGNQTNAARWAKWLGEIRHRGATVEFLSQDPHKVHSCVEEHSAVRIQLVNSEDRRDPLFNCLLGDWYELRASVTGSYEVCIWQLEERRINGRWIKSGFEKFTLEPRYFVLYDSHNTPQSGGLKATGKERIFQKRGRVGVVFWFVKRNWFRLLSRLSLFVFALWFCFGGGIPFAINKFNTWVRSRAAGPVVEPPSPGQPNSDADFAARLKLRRPVPVPAPIPMPALSNPVPVAVALTSNGNAANVSGGIVRSETFKHGTLEIPPSGEEQQESVPRLVLVSREFCALDDGLMLWPGDKCGEFILRAIDFRRRLAVFLGVSNGVSLVVPVGGPVGVRRMRAANESQPQQQQKPVPVIAGPAKNLR